MLDVPDTAVVSSIPNRGVFPFSRFNSIGSLYPADDRQVRQSAEGYFKTAKTIGVSELKQEQRGFYLPGLERRPFFAYNEGTEHAVHPTLARARTTGTVPVDRGTYFKREMEF